MDKYIVEIDGKNICSDSDGKSKLALSVKADNGYAAFYTEIPLTPYTEPDMERVRKEAYKDGYDAGFGRKIDASYQEGLSDAWECARKIYLPEDHGGLGYDMRMKIFNTDNMGWLFKNLSASECIEKIRQYEQEKEEQDGLRQNIQTIVDQCGYTLDEIAEVLQKMKES